MASAVTMNYAEEAQGIAAAAAEIGLPCVISFTVETDGRLPTGMSLGEAIRRVDESSQGEVAYYMINCAHPSHFAAVLGENGVAERIGGIRANASRMSHAELDEAEELDDGNPAELASDYQGLLEQLPHVCVLGGCCGTDHRHVAAIAQECLPVMRAQE
jgi:S-methylmethionine-dependent homocysteine/selenocysteine methylase